VPGWTLITVLSVSFDAVSELFLLFNEGCLVSKVWRKNHKTIFSNELNHMINCRNGMKGKNREKTYIFGLQSVALPVLVLLIKVFLLLNTLIESIETN
jgi:hypothetical protein